MFHLVIFYKLFCWRNVAWHRQKLEQVPPLKAKAGSNYRNDSLLHRSRGDVKTRSALNELLRVGIASRAS